MASELDWAKSLEELLEALRHPETGCPWDKTQDWRSLTRYTLEEVYECIDAIDAGEPKQVKEELGDVLFNIFFYAQIAKEQGLFSISDIAQAVIEKMHSRHPHVFSNESFVSEAEHLLKWEKRKLKDNEAKSALDNIPANFPALMRAKKIQKRAAACGFDWPSVEGALGKCHEELEELSQALSENSGQAAVEEELGDVLFSIVNVARHLKVDAEIALRRSSAKFERRFRHVEQLAREKNIVLDELSIEALEALWNDAKKLGTTEI